LFKIIFKSINIACILFATLFLSTASSPLLSAELASESIARNLATNDTKNITEKIKFAEMIVTAADVPTARNIVESLGGLVISELWIIHSVGAALPIDKIAELSAHPNIFNVTANRQIKAASSVAIASPASSEWAISSPVAIDVGADQVHDQSISGAGVTVAVVDTGFHYDDVSAQGIGTRMIAQADFVDNSYCTNMHYSQQYSNHCLIQRAYSRDDHGHGSHIASTVASQLIDANTGTTLGVAPGANILSIRVLDENGSGTYIDVIEGIQYAVDSKELYNIRVINLSVTAPATGPYFLDPVNQAVAAAWAAGITVVVAAGNDGSHAQTITIPGNSPYVVTVGAINTAETAGDWSDDTMPDFSAAGPTLDGFMKPDVVAPGVNVISHLHVDPDDRSKSAYLARQHRAYDANVSLYGLSGTSMATAVASGVVALMIEARPNLTPDEIKYRLMYSAQASVTIGGELAYSYLQQGSGRIWAPEAVLSDDIPPGKANEGLDVHTELAVPLVSEQPTTPSPVQSLRLANEPFEYDSPSIIQGASGGAGWSTGWSIQSGYSAVQISNSGF